MKIIYLHQYLSTKDGSGSNRSYNFAKALVKSGHSVKIICFKGGRENTGLKNNFKNGWRTGFTDGIEIIEFDIPYSNYDSIFIRSLKFLLFSFKALRFTLIEDVDLIFASSTPLTVSLPALAAKWFRGIPYIFEVRDLWPELPIAMGIIKNKVVIKTLYFLEWLSYRSSIACIGLSPGICEGIISRGISPSNVALIPNICDEKIFKPLKKGHFKRPELINVLNKKLTSDDFIAAYTGAHGQANGLDSIIDAAVEIEKKGFLNIKILFVGDGKLKNKLKKKVKNKGLKNCLFIGLVSKIELAKILKDSVHVGLMVLSNIPEFYNGTSPNKFFDYLACGLPIINNYPGWLAELIKENNCGLVVNPEDPVAFADALIKLSKDSLLTSRMGENSYKISKEKFSRKLLILKFEQFIEKKYFNFKKNNL